MLNAPSPLNAENHTDDHIPVMRDGVLAALAPVAGEVYLDGTFGNGGYSRAVLSAADCHVYGVDRDPEAVVRGQALAQANARFAMCAGTFSDMEALIRSHNIDKLDGIMLDIGVSSMQIDTAARGFSFMREGPLDMRMGDEGLTAGDVVNTFSERQLADIIYVYGEERQSRRIARVICAARDVAKLQTTTDLVNAIEKANGPAQPHKIHPATRTFQALRIFVNDELGELVKAMTAAERLLNTGGRLIVVSFHSLEDRLVKTFLRERAATQSSGSRFMPIAAAEIPSFSLPHNKPILPSAEEIAQNPRARSAKLRYGIRTNADALSDFVPPTRITNAQLEASWQ